ncbi:VIT1/CCC1 transporter family protein [Streptomyces caniscabiei]|uniref:VIT1/CCC1 transporter family protein n=1 Tax=Streptomyces caniscabiei TaxID=2746961 RepID=UPI0029A3BCB4|nr:VIT1/CCC1 transporter family protein [Streptomyces caniscabiei]MDX2775825.1 VIT1/CCC1 transporter family protein [Streptomyces caniscabiei]
MDRKKDSEILARRALQVQRGAARASVLGVNDGLVSTLCIVLAVAGAGATTGNVLLAGFAGLIAGAVSMAAGEWISVRAQVELFGGVIKDIRQLVVSDKELLVDQVSESLSQTGHSPETAKTAASEIAKDDGHLTDVYTRQVMGFNPDELGSPWLAAGSSFILFTAGALAPLAPWFFTNGVLAVWLSIIFTGIGGLIVGGYISASSGNSVVKGALRQLGIIILASAVTYGIGYLFGVTVG